MQAKGHAYSLEALLADSGSRAAPFKGGTFATLYLAPFNYHRIHMPLSGTLRAAWYVPGNLFSVNATTAACVPGLFARNERVVCLIDAGAFTFAMVLVGALFVGSMTTVWHGDITPAGRAGAQTSPSPQRRHTGQVRRDGPLQHGLDGDPLLPPRRAALAARTWPRQHHPGGPELARLRVR